jgi:hypothetical protein
MDGDPRLQPSGYDRAPRDAYFSIDPVIGDDLVWTFKEIGFDYRGKTVLEPCAGRGDLMRQLRSHGMHVAGYDLHVHPGQDRIGTIVTGCDVLEFTGTVMTMIVTNPPYKSPSAERVAEILLKHGQKQWIALLLPVMWLAAKSDKRRVKLLQGGRLHSITFLGRRPTWVEESIGDPDNAPKQDFVWALWRPAEPKTSKPTIVLWAPAREPITDPFK